jgi:hypothetical protein
VIRTSVLTSNNDSTASQPEKESNATPDIVTSEATDATNIITTPPNNDASQHYYHDV